MFSWHVICIIAAATCFFIEALLHRSVLALGLLCLTVAFFFVR